MFRLLTILTTTIVVILLMTVLVAQESAKEKAVKLQGGTDIAIEKIFEHITELTGRNFIAAAVAQGRIVKVPKDMEANLKMLESLLELNGIYLQVETQGGKTFYKALSDRDFRYLQYGEGKFYSEHDELPKDNVFVMVPVTVKYVDAVYMERTLTNRCVNRQGPGSVVSVGHNMLILKDFAPMVAHYVKIIREVDKPPTTGLRIVELEHANPGEIISSLKKGADLDKMLGVFPDSKNGRLVIVGEPAQLDNFEKVIKALDEKAGKRAPILKVYTLEHTTSSKIADMINSLLSENEKERGLIAVSAGSAKLLAVRADKQLQEQLEELVKTVEALSK